MYILDFESQINLITQKFLKIFLGIKIISKVKRQLKNEKNNFQVILETENNLPNT